MKVESRRLSLRAKVAAAFAALALVPLLVLTGVAVGSAVRYLRTQAQASLEYDLEIARLRAARSLRQVGQNLDFLVEAVLRERMQGDGDDEAARALTATFLRTDSTAILRVKAIDAGGDLVFMSTVLAGDEATPGASGEIFYLLQAEEAERGRTLYLPVELRAPGSAAEPGVIPAIAIVEPVYDAAELVGVAVAEASLAELFEGLEYASPGLGGVTGLVDESGRFLYHSERKNDWASLLASQGGINVRTDFQEAVADELLSGGAATRRIPGGGIVSFRPLAAVDLDAPLLVLYRALAPGTLEASVRQFLLLTSGIVAGTLVLVLGAATVSARQLTRPLYELRTAARGLARGEARRPFHFQTGDELQDLADDFTRMADALQTQQQQLEDLLVTRTAALQTTRAELAQVVMHAADAIIGLDGQGRIRFWNRGAETLFGYSEPEALDQDVDQLIGGRASATEQDFIRRAMEQRRTVSNLLTRRTPKSGEPFPVTLTQAPVVDPDGHVVGASLVVRDHRAQSRIEEQMRHSERLAAVSIMAAGLAHEINNPLAILQNRIELMQRDAEDGTALARDLEVLLAHVDRLRGITSDLLAFAREESSGTDRVQVDRVAERLVGLLERTFVTQGLELVADVVALPAVQGDEKAIEAVLVNLLTNAAQATPDGGLVRLTMGLNQERRRVWVWVEDSGPGIPAELRERIFEPFFTTKGGTGLGLTLCRTIVERHGGVLRLDDSFEAGTRFVLELPIHGDAS
ncbi:MAG: ATP-binding protein [Gemmatimonadota bacterium]|nr:PAS domain S-box protein [Gemmatimonadota bacterium]